MSGAGRQVFGSGESFTITTRRTVELGEGDMITDPATGITYYRRDGEIKTVGNAEAVTDRRESRIRPTERVESTSERMIRNGQSLTITRPIMRKMETNP